MPLPSRGRSACPRPCPLQPPKCKCSMEGSAQGKGKAEARGGIVGVVGSLAPQTSQPAKHANSKCQSAAYRREEGEGKAHTNKNAHNVLGLEERQEGSRWREFVRGEVACSSPPKSPQIGVLGMG